MIVDDAEYTADNIVISTGSDPVIPPVPGLRELDGVWTNREVTELKEVPKSLLVLGGGPVGVEMAQAVRRMGAEVSLIEGMDHVLAREPKPLGDALGEALSAEGSTFTSAIRSPPRERTAISSCSSSTARSFAATACWSPLVASRGSTDSASIRSGSSRARAESRSTPGCAPATASGRSATSPGSGRSPTSASTRGGSSPPTSRERSERPTTARFPGSSSPIRRPHRSARGGPLTVTSQLSGVARTSTYTRAYDQKPGFMTLVSDGERLTGAYALGPEAGEWLQQATLAIRAKVPLGLMEDVIQPFPTFSEVFLDALIQLGAKAPARA